MAAKKASHKKPLFCLLFVLPEVPWPPATKGPLSSPQGAEGFAQCQPFQPARAAAAVHQRSMAKDSSFPYWSDDSRLSFHRSGCAKPQLGSLDCSDLSSLPFSPSLNAESKTINLNIGFKIVSKYICKPLLLFIRCTGQVHKANRVQVCPAEGISVVWPAGCMDIFTTIDIFTPVV